VSLIFDTNTILAAVANRPADAARVETTTLLPGGGVATVSVRAAGRAFVVSDSGSARETLLALGVPDFTRGDVRAAHEIAEARGLGFHTDEFVLTDVSADQLPAAIAYVADATRALVSASLESRSRRAQRDLVSRTVDRVRSMFPGATLETERVLLGASTKCHTFDLVMPLAGDRFAIFQTVSPAPASVASAHLKLFDIREVHADWPREAVVDDLEAWASDDLAIMQQVASHVRDVRRGWDDLRVFDA
jgi:hypothetical protein